MSKNKITGWNLKGITQETKHPFLNFFTLRYEVSFGNEKADYSYYVASRHDQEHLLPLKRDLERPDGVLIPLYYRDPKDGALSFLLTKQFRPAVGLYVYSFPAGLMDPDDPDVFETAKREAQEEAGASLKSMELICKTGTTSSGMSDETNAIILAEIESFEQKNLEEFEDISTRLYDAEEVRSMLQDERFFFADIARMTLLYLLERFKA